MDAPINNKGEGAIDGARAVRAGEELDAAKLAAYLGGVLGALGGPVVVEQFPGGHSNLTYLLRVPVADGVRELVLRRPPFGSKVKSAHDMGREHRILSRISAVFPQAPRPIEYCDDPAILGAPFYLMERVRGVILRRVPPPGLDLGPEVMRRLCTAFIDTLADMHAVDWAAAGLADLGRPEGYVTRQVTGWTKRYADSRTDDVPDVDAIAAWLAARIPPEQGASLIHNDYKFDNIVLDPAEPTRIIGVLDWEMSTIGDPLMDLGTTLGYWVEDTDDPQLKLLSFGPTARPGCMTRRELADRYGERTGRDVSDLLFYYCYALFKTAVVLQQIYYRWHQGLTQDPRFAGLGEGVKVLARCAVRAAESGKV